MKSVNSFTKLLLLFVAIVLISIPVLAILEKRADADATKSSITSFNEDYVFFVIEDNQTPLAAAPVTHNYSSILWIVLGLATVLIFFAYSLWFVNTKSATELIVADLPESIRSKIVTKASFFHPIITQSACEEAVYSATEKYFDNPFLF